MRMTENDFMALDDAIRVMDTRERREQYRSGKISNAEHVKDMNVRYRWDLFYISGGNEILDGKDYDDTHVDTALRRIVPNL